MTAFVASGFTVLAAFLLVSRIPVYSGKKLRVPRDRVMPLILAVALVLLLLFCYPWQTLSAGVIAYLMFLPLSVRAYGRRTQVEEAKLAEAAAERRRGNLRRRLSRQSEPRLSIAMRRADT